MLAESDTHLVSLTAVLMFRVTPVMSDEPQQTLQAERERERERERESLGEGQWWGYWPSAWP